MNYKKIVLLLFLFLSAAGIWIVADSPLSSANQLVSNSQISPRSFLELDYIKESDVIEQDLDLAKDKAHQWQTDAGLMAISMEFENGLNYDALEQYNYVFSSDSFIDKYWIVNNSKIKKQIEQAYVDKDLFGDIQLEYVDTKYLKINFVHALEIIEQAGGYDFRLNHANNYIVTLLLMQPQNGVLSWHVVYSSDKEEKTWKVNAASGLVQSQ